MKKAQVILVLLFVFIILFFSLNARVYAINTINMNLTEDTNQEPENENVLDDNQNNITNFNTTNTGSNNSGQTVTKTTSSSQGDLFSLENILSIIIIVIGIILILLGIAIIIRCK